jgi:HNH endonuclease/AP2 domain
LNKRAKIKELLDMNIKNHITHNPYTGIFIRISTQEVAGYITEVGYVVISLFGISYHAHRLAFFFMGEPVPDCVDHKNGIRWDNRWKNLRSATNSQNQQNSKISTRNKTGYKGVSYHKVSKKFQASIMNNKREHLGYYNTALEAALVYDKRAKELYKDFAKINFMD